MHSVLSHRRPRTKRSKATLLVGLLSGLLVVGAIGAPMAMAQTSSWAVLNPNRTIYAGQATTVHVLSGAGALRTAGMLASLQAATSKGWKTVDAKKIAANGRISFTVKPRATTKLRVGILGRGMVGGSASNVITITVSNRGLAVVAEAAKHRGKMYQFGAAGPYRFDCSGYTQYVYKKFGRSLPHSATQQSRSGVGISKAAARPGDLLLFGGGGRYTHAGIYAGNGAMWDSSTSGQPVALRRIYSQGFVVRRIV